MIKALITLRIIGLVLWIVAGIAALLPPEGITTASYVLCWVGCLVAHAQLLYEAILKKQQEDWIESCTTKITIKCIRGDMEESCAKYTENPKV